MNDSQIIDALGGTCEVARLCKVKSPSVSEWKRNGIPDARRQYLGLLYPDLFTTLHPVDASHCGSESDALKTAKQGKAA